MPSPSLHIAVSKRLREITLAVDLTFAGGVSAIVGPSGAGKSTLLRLVAGLARPDTGAIRLGERTLDDAARKVHMAPGRRDISLVFQEYALFPHLNVARNVAYGLEARRVGRSERRRRVGAVLERLGIATLAHEHPARLSGGQRQRVALARVLVTEPSALLLDEPVADFTGMNFFEGDLQAHEPDRLARVAIPGGVEVYLPGEGLHAGPVSLGLRPWEIALSPAPPAGSARNVLAGRVREVLPLGGRVRVMLGTGPDGALPLVAEITPEALASLDLREGQQLYASFKASAVSVAPR